MVSVIIPTYNRASTIRKSILSVKEQTYQNIEIIIVDDASEDDTEAIVKSIDDNRIIYIKNPVNKGVATSRNIGIKSAKGEFIAFNDSDDVWMHDKLEKQMLIMEEYPECMLVYCAFCKENLNGKMERIPSNKDKLEDLQGNIFFKLLRKNTISTQTMLFRRKCFEKVGLFKEEMRALDDCEMALRVAFSNKIFYVDEVLVHVFVSENSINLPEKNYIEHFKANIQILNTFWNKIGDNGKLQSFLRTAEYYLLNMNLDEVNIYIKKILPFISGEREMEQWLLQLLLNYRRYKYKDHIMTEIYDITLDKWGEYYKKNSIFKIAIYGNGYIGKIIREKSVLSGIEVSYVIDRNVESKGYPVIPLFEVEQRSDVDMIVISIFDETNRVKNELNGKINTKIIHIDALLAEIKK